MADGYWYHGNGKIGGEFCHIKPNKKDRYGEYVKVVRCKDCKHHEDEEVGMVYCPNIVCGWVDNNFYCGYGKRKDEALLEKLRAAYPPEKDPVCPFCGRKLKRIPHSRELYECDPEKNTECRKTGCYINGGECHHTTRKEYRREAEP